MLLKQEQFKKMILALGFTKRDGDSEIYFDDTVFGDCWVYFSGECDESHDEYAFRFDATSPEVNIVDFILKGMASKAAQEDFSEYEA